MTLTRTNGEAALSAGERERLGELEGVVRRGIDGAVETFNALAEIRERELFRETHASFDAYCEERFGVRSNYAGRLIRSARTLSHLQETLPIGTPLPQNEAQAREVALAPAELQPDVWSAALAQASGGRVTARQVAQAREGIVRHPALPEPPAEEESLDERRAGRDSGPLPACPCGGAALLFNEARGPKRGPFVFVSTVRCTRKECGRSTEECPTPADAGECWRAEVAEAGSAAIEAHLDAADALWAEQLLLPGASEEPPPALPAEPEAKAPSARPKLMQQGHSDHFQTPPEALRYLLPFLPRPRTGFRIWECSCGEGKLATFLREAGYAVIATDLREEREERDFLTWEPDAYDLLVTNPPFARKDAFLERAYALGKPFAFLLPVTAQAGQRRHELYRQYGLQVIVPEKRIAFDTPSGRQGKESSPWFPVQWFTHGLELPSDLVFAAEDGLPARASGAPAFRLESCLRCGSEVPAELDEEAQEIACGPYGATLDPRGHVLLPGGGIACRGCRETVLADPLRSVVIGDALEGRLPETGDRFFAPARRIEKPGLVIVLVREERLVPWGSEWARRAGVAR